MGLRFARSLDKTDPSAAARSFAAFGRRFAQDRDSLPQSDRDRAFHLVALAAKNIDYELPFSTDYEAPKLIERSHQLLDEALSLDPRCHDAWRMKAAARNDSFEDFFAFLAEHADEVRESCEEERDRAAGQEEVAERARLAADIAMRPYLRWVATQAAQALICGRNREAARLARVALDEDPRDMSDARFTLFLALAKLEDEASLDAFLATWPQRSQRPADDAWALLSHLALAHKRHDLAAARDHLGKILRTYPHAPEALIRQMELPEGVFARLSVIPYSEDELVLAISEGTVLLQEGRDPEGRGVLSTWIMHETANRHPHAMLAVMSADPGIVEGGSTDERW